MNNLHRTVLAGAEFDKLIPSSDCKVVFVGEGDTGKSIKEMVKVIENNLHQGVELAKKLGKPKLQDTVSAIHHFLFHHFQYMADDADQMLRSLSCSWKFRHQGIDCKSYTIIGSIILTNLGIKHYIRRIKQPGYAPDQYTHVYLIVPVNQKTASLTDGYYVIDGTLRDNIEPAFTHKNDTAMLKHYALNGAFTGKLTVQDVKNLVNSNSAATSSSSTSSGGKTPKIKITTNTIKDIFAGAWSPNCIGGTYDRDHTRGLESRLAPFFNNLADNINTAVIFNPTSNLHATNVANAVNAWLRTTQLWLDHATRTVNKPGGWKSRCSRDHVGVVREAARMLNTIGINGILVWLAKYYDFQMTTQQLPSNDYAFDSGIKKNEFFATIPVQLVSNVVRKPNISSIVAFEFDENDLKLLKDNKFNAAQWASTLTKVIATYELVSGNSSSSNALELNAQTGDFKDLPTEQTAGFGVLGWVLVAVGLGWAWQKFKK